MSALEKLIERQANGEKLTSLEFAVFWCTDRVCAEKAAEELADYELRLDLLAKGATWEYDENERLKEKLSLMRFRLDYIKNNISDGVAIRFALEASDAEIEEAMTEGK